MAQVTALRRMVLYMRACLYWITFAITTITMGGTVVLLFFLPFRQRYFFMRFWAVLNLLMLKWICGLSYDIEGLENIPNTPAIVFSKHQSLYEIMVLLIYFQPIAWVLKKELLRVPFFGWGLALLKPTAIDRKSGQKAIDQIVQESGKSLNEGRWVVIFPEGTRTVPGATPKYKIGGGILASRTGYPVIPVAQNSGEYWTKNSAIKWPGTVKVSIGAAIESKNKKPEDILKEAESFIETKMQEISNPANWNR